MRLTGPMGRRFIWLFLWASAPANAVSGQSDFAVIHLANTTDDITIDYIFTVGRDSRRFTIRANQFATHSYRREAVARNNDSSAAIDFGTGIDRQGIRKHYTLRALASPQETKGGAWYVFEKSTGTGGEESIDLVSLSTFLTHNNDRVAARLGQIHPDLGRSLRDSAAARLGLGPDRSRRSALGGAPATASIRVQETGLNLSGRLKQLATVPDEFRPYISRDAYDALLKFRLGSKVDADENERLQVAYDRAYEEGRFIDAQEANYIRAIEREPVAALWKMLSDPAGNAYYWPKFTPVEERLKSLGQPLVGAGADRLIYVKSDDDLAGLRLAVRRPPQGPLDGGLETAAIIASRWVKGKGVVPLDPPDNMRVLMRLKDSGDHAMLGMSFSLREADDGTWDLRPEIYTSPKFGDDRFKGTASTAVSPRGCMDCHSFGFNIKASKFVGRTPGWDQSLQGALKEMQGVADFLADARKRGATAQEIAAAESIVHQPDTEILGQPRLRVAVVKLWNAIYYANQPYLDDSDSRFIEYHDRYGIAWLEAGDIVRAIDHLSKAISRAPDAAHLYLKRGRASLFKQRYDESLLDFDHAIRLEPRLVAAHNLRARVLATAPIASLRNGVEAVRAATKACELTDWQAAEYLDTLAAAYAEAGDFREAAKWQEKALADTGLDRVFGENEAKAARGRLELYRQDHPIRLGPPPK